MGTKHRSIVGMDVGEPLALLNRAFADEWLACFQYWLGAIGVYHESAKVTRDTDHITYEMVLQILTGEVQHKEDLQALLEDLDLMVQGR
jgi:ferritin-like protein